MSIIEIRTQQLLLPVFAPLLLVSFLETGWPRTHGDPPKFWVYENEPLYPANTSQTLHQHVYS